MYIWVKLYFYSPPSLSLCGTGMNSPALKFLEGFKFESQRIILEHKI